MKHILLPLLTILVIGTGVNAQNVNIPDANFKTYLIGNTAINTNGDTEIQISEATAFTGSINIPNLSISDLSGIESFTELTRLYCYDNAISSLDISQNTALIVLNCSDNSLSSLDVTQNTALTELFCSNNLLNSLDVTQNPALYYLHCRNNSISSLDLTQNPALFDFQCTSNSISSLDLTQNIALNKILCNANSLTSLDVTQNTALSWLNCGINSISSLDVTQNTVLNILQCSSNSISSLDVTQNTVLTNLSCGDNLLSTLDVTQNTALTGLHCFLNSLSSLDVTQNTALTQLNCSDNSLSSLDITQNTALTLIHCQNNNINSLDCRQNTDLYSFWCHNNMLTSLTIANGNNTNIQGGAFGFNATGNPNLYCIEIDTGFTAPGFWQEDITVSYSDNCVVLVNSITVQGQGGISTITTNAGSLQMEATVLPTYADDVSYTWSVTNGTGSATISATGLLTASADGTVDVIATANDASGAVGTKTITISNQILGINEFSLHNLQIYPNPTDGLINLNSLGKLNPKAIGSIKIMDLTGKTIKFFNKEFKQLDISEFTSGIYFLEIATTEKKSVIKIIKK